MSTTTKRKVRLVKVKSLDTRLMEAKQSCQKEILKCLNNPKFQCAVEQLSINSEITANPEIIHSANTIFDSLNHRMNANVDKAGSIVKPNINLFKALGVSAIIQENLLISPNDIAGKLQVLSNSNDIPTTKIALASLNERVVEMHNFNLCELVCKSVVQASIEQGFKNIETKVDKNMTKIIASDECGHALITEIKNENRECNINSEVAGFFDGSCHKIMDNFEKSLMAKGIQGESIECHDTFGIPLLETTKSFLSKVYKAQLAKNKDKKNEKTSTSTIDSKMNIITKRR